MAEDLQSNVIPFAPPALSDVMAFRGLYALASTRSDKESGKTLLTTTHFASCLVFGPSPLWGVWTVQGKFLRFYGFRHEIAAAYPRLVWRRRMASWSLMAVDDLRPAARRVVLSERYHAPLPKGMKTHD